uniref:Sodium/hydrogen exchanger n=1 Tax=Strigamia maritima TaxID=126957 RepID=T1JK84_STRMM
MLRTEEKCWRWPSWLLFAVVITAISASVNGASSAAVESTHRSSGRADEHGFEPPDHEADSTHHVYTDYPVASVDFKRVQIPFIIALWIFLATLAKIGFHMANKLSSIFPESCLLIVVGVVIGLLLFYTQLTTVSPLTPDTFFLYMLPPIVLDAGYFMPNRLFFDNLGSILLFAVIGTIWNTVTIGLSLYAVGLTGLYSVELKILDAFLFSALISAVDPVAVLAVFEEIQVNEVLYIVVFGESLLNDAVTVVLYHMFQAYTEMVEVNGIKYTDYLSGIASFFVVALGGTAIGVVWGYMTAFVTRFTNHVRVIEPILVFVMSYMSYLNAEMFKLSGILAITFCGISMKNYVEANISHKSHTTVKYTMKMIASSSETIIFMFLGVSTVTDDHDWNTWFVIFTILFCTVYRAIGVVILTAFANHFRVQKLNKVEEFVMAYGGLRGAVAFALVLTINVNAAHRHMFITTTIAVVYFTVFVQGITIKPLVDILGVKKSEKRKVTMNERIHERYYDNNFIRRWFVRDHKTNDPKILETFSKLNIKDAMNMVHSSHSALPRVGTTEFSFSNLFGNYTQSNLSRSQGSFSPELSGATWDRDLKEMNYLPAGRDINEANLHHILSDAMFKPPRRSRKYSRSQIHEPEVHPQFHHKMRMQIRHVLSEQSKHKKMKERKKNGATGSGGKGLVLNGAA